MSDSGTTQPRLRIYGAAGSSAAYTIRDFLFRSDVPFESIELKTDEQARDEAGVESLKDPRLPVCVFPDGTRMEKPTMRRLRRSSVGSATRRDLSMTFLFTALDRPV